MSLSRLLMSRSCLSGHDSLRTSDNQPLSSSGDLDALLLGPSCTTDALMLSPVHSSQSHEGLELSVEDPSFEFELELQDSFGWFKPWIQGLSGFGRICAPMKILDIDMPDLEQQEHQAMEEERETMQADCSINSQSTDEEGYPTDTEDANMEPEILSPSAPQLLTPRRTEDSRQLRFFSDEVWPERLLRKVEHRTVKHPTTGCLSLRRSYAPPRTRISKLTNRKHRKSARQ